MTRSATVILASLLRNIIWNWSPWSLEWRWRDDTPIIKTGPLAKNTHFGPITRFMRRSIIHAGLRGMHSAWQCWCCKSQRQLPVGNHKFRSLISQEPLLRSLLPRPQNNDYVISLTNQVSLPDGTLNGVGGLQAWNIYLFIYSPTVSKSLTGRTELRRKAYDGSKRVFWRDSVPFGVSSLPDQTWWRGAKTAHFDS